MTRNAHAACALHCFWGAIPQTPAGKKQNQGIFSKTENGKRAEESNVFSAPPLNW
jgi:hypothetical protein